MQSCPRVSRGSALKFTMLFTNIRRVLSVPYCPTENEAADRKNRGRLNISQQYLEQECKETNARCLEAEKLKTQLDNGVLAGESVGMRKMRKPGDPALEE